MGAALQNKAIDAAEEVPPFNVFVIEQGLGAKWIDPDTYIRPTPYETNAYFANTDWLRDNPDLARRLFVAIVRGARQYCQAYHHDEALRAEMLDLLVKYGVTTDRAVLDKLPWPARNPDGRFNLASIADIQDWFFKHGLITKTYPIERMVDTRFAEIAAKELGPFVVTNQESKLAGCR